MWGSMTTRTPPACPTLRLLLGDQLNPEHSWFATRRQRGLRADGECGKRN